MNQPHKHAALIKAWADGAEIQAYITLHGPGTWSTTSRPSWNDDVEYRIKPEVTAVPTATMEKP